MEYANDLKCVCWPFPCYAWEISWLQISHVLITVEYYAMWMDETFPVSFNSSWPLTNRNSRYNGDICFFPQWLYSPCWALASFFSSLIIFYTDGSTPWTSDKSVARPLPTHRTTQTQNKRIYRHPCLEWDSNPRSQRLGERREFMP
jgi:hypothetical protein